MPESQHAHHAPANQWTPANIIKLVSLCVGIGGAGVGGTMLYDFVNKPSSTVGTSGMTPENWRDIRSEFCNKEVALVRLDTIEKKIDRLDEKVDRVLRRSDSYRAETEANERVAARRTVP
jgi:hypothetical protein